MHTARGMVMAYLLAAACGTGAWPRSQAIMRPMGPLYMTLLVAWLVSLHVAHNPPRT
jgi:hypothetical protein